MIAPINYLLVLLLLQIHTPFLTLASPSPTHPHVLYILADDLGWRYVDWHRTDLVNQTLTPNLHQLLRTGVELDRLYSFKYCSPSRSSIQTGRNPISVNVQNVVPEVSNAKDPIGGYQGIPTEMTGIASILQSQGYSTNLIGKWDVGMATSLHHPRARGYDTWLGYWHHSNDYWTHTEETCNGTAVFDLWRYNATFDGPALEHQNGPACSQSNQAPAGEKCVYEESLLTDSVIEVVKNHDLTNVARPLFLFWSMHLVHMPLQVPEEYLAKYKNIKDTQRRSMTAMVHYLDDDVQRVLEVLHARDMYKNTLIIVHSDNGGEIMGAGICGGNNWGFNSVDNRGLRGGKFSNFEGGIRVNGFISGGVLPLKVRGRRIDTLFTIWDFYATIGEGILGVDITDHRAAAAGLPAHDSINQWPLVTGSNETSRRTSMFIGETSALSPNSDGRTLVGGLIQGRLKILLGAPDRFHTISQNVLTGPNWPNVTSHLVPLLHLKTCGRDPTKGCLFDIYDDPTESHNLANVNASMRSTFLMMLARVDAMQAESTFVYSPVRGTVDKRACEVSHEKYNGYWGPFIVGV